MSDARAPRRFASLPPEQRDAMVKEQFCYLTTTGRLSGEQRTIEIWFAIQGATLYMMAGNRYQAGWVANLRANPSASVRVGAETFETQARIVTDAQEDALARRLLLDKYTSRRDNLADWGRGALPVAYDI